jgi:hypothetical protein
VTVEALLMKRRKRALMHERDGESKPAAPAWRPFVARDGLYLLDCDTFALRASRAAGLATTRSGHLTY